MIEAKVNCGCEIMLYLEGFNVMFLKCSHGSGLRAISVKRHNLETLVSYDLVRSRGSAL